VAVTVTEVEAVTLVVSTLTLAPDAEANTLALPAGTTIVAGAGNTVELLDVMVTMAPPDGAGSLSVTARVTLKPPTTLEGVTVTEATLGSTTGATVAAAVLLAPL
jgi:hypothetical protein